MSDSNKGLEFITSKYTIREMDCVDVAEVLPAGSVTLACHDVPYNMGQAYSDYVDTKTQEEYLDYLRPRLMACRQVLANNGSMWVAINDANVSELDIMCKRELGLYPRKKICWHYTFGQNHTKNFTSAHTTWLWYTVCSDEKYIFNYQDPANRIPSARQAVYGDKRANPKGRLPDDVWILRPQQVPEAFTPYLDTWYFPRVCGTFKAKIKESPNQMPVAMMERIIRFCSNPGDLVIDGFNGTGTTGEAALRLGRRYAGFDISKACIQATQTRLSTVRELTDVEKDQMDLFRSDDEK